MRCPGCRASWTSTASAWRLAAADLETPGARYRKGKRPEKDPLVPAHDRAPHLDRPSRTALRRVGHAARVSGGHRTRADPWPLNPDGELINWAIVESLEGLQNVREIAAVEGLGVLFAGANTLREVFSTTGAGGEWILDDVRWEGAIQKVLAACHEFHLPCGYPPNENDVEERLRQGFSVFLGAGERGFSTIDIGRRAAGR